MKSFKIAKLIALIYICLRLPQVIYEWGFDGMFFELHPLYSLGLSVLWTAAIVYIMLMYKKVIHSVYKTTVADKSIYYFASLVLGLLLLSIYVLYSSGMLQMALSLESDSQELDLSGVSLSGISSSFYSIFYLWIINLLTGIFLISLGNKVRKISPVSDPLKMTQGIIFIVYGIVSILSVFNLFGTEYFEQFVNLIAMASIGVAFHKYENITPVRLTKESISEAVKRPSKPKPEQKAPVKVKSDVKPKVKSPVFKKNSKQENTTETDQEWLSIKSAISNFRLESLEQQDAVTSYYNSLSTYEIERLNNLAAKHYLDKLSSSEVKILVLKYISDKTLYDHNKYAPK